MLITNQVPENPMSIRSACYSKVNFQLPISTYPLIPKMQLLINTKKA